MRLELQFLGSGNSRASALGNASAVLLEEGRPLLGIDYGWTAPEAWARQWGGPPPALYLTHAHLDHCGGLEALFYERILGRMADPSLPLIPIYCPVALVPILHQRLASYPSPLAEGGANFWDAFQLIPVGERFWLGGRLFVSPAVRHHQPGTAYGLALPGVFLYSGDTRPIPEVLSLWAAGSEPVFHDASLRGNPSHTGLEDLEREYSPEQRGRMVLYHLGGEEDCQAAEAAGYRVARPGDVFTLPTMTQFTGAASGGQPLPLRD